ncbi:MAG: VWA domain-containing protein [Acidobacteria bacterium]|nr:VWA domain-containing protein [Acidobacteriota bacterium]
MKFVLVLLIGLQCCVLSVWAQDWEEETPVIRASVDVVNVLCTVRDRQQRYVTDLKQEDFEIIEDGVRQKVQFFSNETGEDAQPMTVVLLIDTSGSVKDKLAFEQEAASEFLSQTLRKNKDLAAVVQFDSEVSLIQDFTYDYSVLENAILSIRAGGSTKLYDAIWVSVNELLRHEVGRRMLVILSDGADTQSMTRDNEALKIAQEQDVVIYGIGVRSGRFGSDFGKLKKFAEGTGGLFFNSKVDLQKIREAFMRINRGIKSQYALGYVSTNPRRDGSFREIKVRMKRSGLNVTHRKGYYAPRDEP